jgi:hypothetical protein
MKGEDWWLKRDAPGKNRRPTIGTPGSRKRRTHAGDPKRTGCCEALMKE